MTCPFHELLSARVSMQDLDRREVKSAKINAKINAAVFHKLTRLSVCLFFLWKSLKLRLFDSS